MKRTLLILILLISLLLPNLSIASAIIDSNNIENLKNHLKRTDGYNDYKDIIKSEYISNETMTDEGYRIFVSYNLSHIDGEKTLVFISDENLNLLYSGIVDNTDSNNIYITDIQLKTTEIINLRYNDCTTERCTRTRGRVSYDPDPTCSLIVGSQCIALGIVGNPILIAFCRVGVWVGCNVSYDRICTQSETVPFCEY